MKYLLKIINFTFHLNAFVVHNIIKNITYRKHPKNYDNVNENTKAIREVFKNSKCLNTKIML